MVWILFMNTRRKLGSHAQTLGALLSRCADADARGVKQVLDRVGHSYAFGSCTSQVFDRGAEVIARGAVPFASQGLDRGAKAAARGAARCAPQVFDQGAQAGALNFSCGDAALPQQEKNTRQMSRRT
jgi:surface antigen